MVQQCTTPIFCAHISGSKDAALAEEVEASLLDLMYQRTTAAQIVKQTSRKAHAFVLLSSKHFGDNVHFLELTRPLTMLPQPISANRVQISTEWMRLSGQALTKFTSQYLQHTESAPQYHTVGPIVLFTT